MSHAQGYAGARGPESQGVIINAVEHSLSAQSLISAKEEGGTAHPLQPLLCLKFVFKWGIDYSFHLLKSARSIFPYLKVIPWFCIAHLLLRITRWPP